MTTQNSELQKKLDQLYIDTGRSKDSPRIMPRDFDRHATAIINSEVCAVLDRLEKQKQNIPVHGGTDSFYPSQRVQVVPVKAIEAERSKYGNE
jgi:hypothetical protein